MFSRITAWAGTAGRDPAEQLSGLGFLDLYAGSGAMGLEAYSRGARVTWVEKNPDAARVIRANLAALPARGRLVVQDVNRFLAGAGEQFEVVWLDPPYAQPGLEIDRVLAALDTGGWLATGGRVIVERPGRASAIEFPESFLNAGQRRYGDTVIWFADKGYR